jgi:autotransporter-associated beta strand protein
MKMIKNIEKLLVRMIVKSIVPASVIMLAIQASWAGSATWQVTPMDNDWNNPANWTAGGPPNGPSDTATFSLTQGPSVSVSTNTEVNEVIFDSTPYTIEVPYPNGITLTISGAGITNESGVTQTFLVHGDLFLQNNAAVGNSVTVETGSGGSGYVQFSGNAAAGNCMFNLDPGTVEFDGNATADNGVFDVHGFTFCGSGAGAVAFYDTASAGSGTFILDGGAVCGNGGGGSVYFSGTSTAGNAVFTINGATSTDESGGFVSFQGSPEEGPTAGNATLIANGGSGGGSGGAIQFVSVSAGGTSRLELFGNASLDVNPYYIPSLTVGSIEGTGTVTLDNGVNLIVGSSNLSTTFSGIIQDGVNHLGSLTKIGTGTLTLSGANTYTGGTTVTEGTLLVTNRRGSGTGSGAVQVNAGTLGGTGKIGGTVTVGMRTGPGAFLSPGVAANTPGILTIQKKLTFKADSTYTYGLKTTNATADQVVAKGVTINSGALFSFASIGNTRLAPGTIFTAINNTGATPIAGRFSNLADGSTFPVGSNTYLVSYEGGTGNDLTLTVQ